MKFVGIVGNNADFSYNRCLLKFMSNHFKDEISVQEIRDVPMFCESQANDVPASVQYLVDAIKGADGVIIATPEYDHSITAALKSVIEWLSYVGHPLNDKPVMIVGVSLGQQGTSWAQTQLREILNSPGINAHVMPGNQFMMSFAKQSFDDNGELADERTVGFLDKCFASFIKFTKTQLIEI